MPARSQRSGNTIVGEDSQVRECLPVINEVGMLLWAKTHR